MWTVLCERPRIVERFEGKRLAEYVAVRISKCETIRIVYVRDPAGKLSGAFRDGLPVQ